jgi:galactokinase/mevalonate kinase-like predicted kinase
MHIHIISSFIMCFVFYSSVAEFPEVILSIEKHELGISAGLQDRVIQTYGGVVHMDFSPSPASTDNEGEEGSTRPLSSRYTSIVNYS